MQIMIEQLLANTLAIRELSAVVVFTFLLPMTHVIVAKAKSVAAIARAVKVEDPLGAFDTPGSGASCSAPGAAASSSSTDAAAPVPAPLFGRQTVCSHGLCLAPSGGRSAFGRRRLR